MYISLSDDESGDETDSAMATSTDASSSDSCIATSESDNEARSEDSAATRDLENFSRNAANNESGIVYDAPPMRLPRIPRQTVLKTRRMSAGMSDTPCEHPRRKSSIRRTRKYSDFTLYKTVSGSETESTPTPESTDHNAIHELSKSVEEHHAQDNVMYLVNNASNLQISD